MSVSKILIDYQVAEDEKFFQILDILNLSWRIEYNSWTTITATTIVIWYPWPYYASNKELVTNYFPSFPENGDKFIFEEWKNSQSIREEAYMAVSRVGLIYYPQGDQVRLQLYFAFEWKNIAAEE